MGKEQRKDISMDVEVAVALEVGLTRIERAEQLGGMAEALAFNRDLWRVIGFLSDSPAMMRHRAELRTHSLRLAQGEELDFLTLNRRFAGLFAAQSAAYGVMSVMLNAWRAHRRQHADAEFSRWLLDRLDAGTAQARVA